MSGERQEQVDREELAQDRGDLVLTALAEGIKAEGATTEEGRDLHLARAKEAVAEVAAVPEPSA
ncbi:MAG TPA: hypothetical protein VIJ21_00635 [Solirubrobacterales bacterium]